MKLHGGEGSANSSGHPTGIPNLDLILGGGIPSGSLIMVVGSPGSGKTTLARTGAKRLVIDSIAELERALQVAGDARRVDEYLSALVVILRDRGITTLAIKESRRTVVEDPEYGADSISMVADNVVLPRQRGEGEYLRRTLAVLKMRYSVHDVTIHDFLVTPPHGIQVSPSADETNAAPASVKPPVTGA